MEHATSTTAAVEQWRLIEGYNGQYEVSTFGNVRSNGRFFGTVYIEYNKPILLKLYNNRGYMYVKLSNSMFPVHRLVAKAFIPNPQNLQQVNHKDETKSNNNVTNLEWCSSKYNINYGTGIIRRALAYGKPIEQLTRDGKHIEYYKNAAEAARINNGIFTENHIRRAVTGKRPTAYGYRWRHVNK